MKSLKLTPLLILLTILVAGFSATQAQEPAPVTVDLHEIGTGRLPNRHLALRLRTETENRIAGLAEKNGPLRHDWKIVIELTAFSFLPENPRISRFVRFKLTNANSPQTYLVYHTRFVPGNLEKIVARGAEQAWKKIVELESQ